MIPKRKLSFLVTATVFFPIRVTSVYDEHELTKRAISDRAIRRFMQSSFLSNKWSGAFIINEMGVSTQAREFFPF